MKVDSKKMKKSPSDTSPQKKAATIKLVTLINLETLDLRPFQKPHTKGVAETSWTES